MLIFCQIIVCALGVHALIGRKDDEANNFFRRTTGITSGDGGFSVEMSANRTLWLFGDSHVDDINKKDGTQPCFFQARNAAMVQPINNWKQSDTKTYTGSATPFKSLFKAKNDSKQFFWPGHGFQMSDINTVYVYCSELENTGKGGNMGFRSTGNDYFCRLNANDMKVLGLEKLPNFKGIDFGTGFVPVMDHNQYVYAFGQRGNGKMMSRSLYVSRFLKSKPGNSFEYWNGATWSNDLDKVHPLLDDVGNTMSVSKVSQNGSKIDNLLQV